MILLLFSERFTFLKDRPFAQTAIDGCSTKKISYVVDLKELTFED